MGIVDFRAKAGERVDAAYFLKELTIVTKGIREDPRALLIPYEWREILEEALTARGIPVPAVRAAVDGDKAE